MIKSASYGKALLIVMFAALALVSWTAAVQSMPAQVIIIRHADKYDDRHKIHLTPKGRIRAKALSQFFQSDPRAREFGAPAAIIAMSPTEAHRSVRSLETVQLLAQDLGLEVVSRFTYGQQAEMVNWLKSLKEYDGKTVLICWQHIQIADIAKALGVADLRPRVWPHETYDRFWLINFSPQDGKVTSFRNLPQRLLFGDSYQAASLRGLTQPDSGRFTQTYSEKLTKTGAPVWQFHFVGEIKGDFSKFSDDTIPVLRIGGYCFGYYLTTLGFLKKSAHAVVKVNEAKGTGSLLYHYQAPGAAASRSYARVSFTWNNQSLRVEFRANVDESKIQPEIDVPVDVGNTKPQGLIIGATPCYIAFGEKKYDAPAGLSYKGAGKKSKTPGKPETYHAFLECRDGILIFMEQKELMEQ